jgi:hypothetical protein
MAFLESRLKQIDEIISPPSKEGGLSALDGKKIPNHIGFHIYTVPLYHHSFKYWKQYLAKFTFEVLNATIERCESQCRNEVNSIQGNNFTLIDANLKKCFGDCKSSWYSPIVVQLEVLISLYFSLQKKKLTKHLINVWLERLKKKSNMKMFLIANLSDFKSI